jgi:hypothetical protein
MSERDEANKAQTQFELQQQNRIYHEERMAQLEKSKELERQLSELVEGPDGLNSHKHRVKMYLKIIEDREKELSEANAWAAEMRDALEMSTGTYSDPLVERERAMKVRKVLSKSDCGSDLLKELEALRSWKNNREEQLKSLRARCVNTPCYGPDEILGEWEDGTIHCWECEFNRQEKELVALRKQVEAGDALAEYIQNGISFGFIDNTGRAAIAAYREAGEKK